MRMWMVNPKQMCSKHLLGEHVECHMFAKIILKGISLKGYQEKGLFQSDCLVSRHDELANEMIGRGMNHTSPLKLRRTKGIPKGIVDKKKSMLELQSRCKECKARMMENAL